VLALTPGASLLVWLDTRFDAPRVHTDGGDGTVAVGGVVHGGVGVGASRAGSISSGVRVMVEYLTSYEGMGRVYLRCAAGCACAPTILDAHRTDAHRNVSVFLQARVYVRTVRLTVLPVPICDAIR